MKRNPTKEPSLETKERILSDYHREIDRLIGEVTSMKSQGMIDVDIFSVLFNGASVVKKDEITAFACAAIMRLYYKDSSHFPA